MKKKKRKGGFISVRLSGLSLKLSLSDIFVAEIVGKFIYYL